jgi:predicted RNA-binding protein with PUA-like domain
MRHWLLKTEPSTFSIDDLRARGREAWDGVRNYQARNSLRDDVQVGDRVLIYHSSTDIPAIVGTARVARAAYPDPSAWDPDSAYFDPKSGPENPRWVMVDVAFESKFAAPLSLAELRTMPALGEMVLLRKGMRLSVQPVTPEEFAAVLEAAQGPAAKRPAAKRPAAKRPAAKRPAAKRPAAKRPAAKRPAAKRPAAKRPAAKRPAQRS